MNLVRNVWVLRILNRFYAHGFSHFSDQLSSCDKPVQKAKGLGSSGSSLGQPEALWIARTSWAWAAAVAVARPSWGPSAEQSLRSEGGSLRTSWVAGGLFDPQNPQDRRWLRFSFWVSLLGATQEKEPATPKKKEASRPCGWHSLAMWIPFFFFFFSSYFVVLLFFFFLTDRTQKPSGSKGTKPRARHTDCDCALQARAPELPPGLATGGGESE